ncbi:MAG: RHS repeat-associated core domain-containing protein, partial [Acidobacteriaceae bacterium]
PYGVEPHPPADANHYKFAGLERDAETGLDHTWFRQYASPMGRWLSSDPYNGSYDIANPQSFNRYAYVGNNPLTHVDPTGLYSIWVDVWGGGCDLTCSIGIWGFGGGGGFSPSDGGGGGGGGGGAGTGPQKPNPTPPTNAPNNPTIGPKPLPTPPTKSYSGFLACEINYDMNAFKNFGPAYEFFNAGAILSASGKLVPPPLGYVFLTLTAVSEIPVAVAANSTCSAANGH